MAKNHMPVSGPTGGGAAPGEKELGLTEQTGFKGESNESLGLDNRTPEGNPIPKTRTTIGAERGHKIEQ